MDGCGIVLSIGRAGQGWTGIAGTGAVRATRRDLQTPLLLGAVDGP